MILKILGAVLVIFSCGSVGFKMVSNYRQEENALRQLINILDYMESELKFRLTPIPELCHQIATENNNVIGCFFEKLECELNMQHSADIEQCCQSALSNLYDIPEITRKEICLLGNSIGRFDLEGQLKGLDSVRQDCKRQLIILSDNRENRLRSYQTLGLCAGAALAILFI